MGASGAGGSGLALNNLSSFQPLAARSHSITGLASLQAPGGGPSFVGASFLAEGAASLVSVVSGDWALKGASPSVSFSFQLPFARDPWGVLFLGSALEDGLCVPLSAGRAVALRPTCGGTLRAVAEWRSPAAGKSDTLEVGAAPAGTGAGAALLGSRSGAVWVWDHRAPPPAAPGAPLLRLPAPPALLAPLPALGPHALLAADADALAGAWDARFAARPLFTLGGYANAPARRTRPALLGALVAAPDARRDAVLLWSLCEGGGAGARPPVAAVPATHAVEGVHLAQAWPAGNGPWPALVVLSTMDSGAQRVVVCGAAGGGRAARGSAGEEEDSE